MVGCKQSNNTAMGDVNKFFSRCASTTYPSPILVMTSPKSGAVEAAGVSPFSVTMQVKVGLSGKYSGIYDWGTLTGWCISWGDGTQNTGVFGSPIVGSDGGMYAVASATHSYTNTDPTTTHYLSKGYRPWATVSDTCGNAVATDYGTYIYVCRSDAVPDNIGGCGYLPIIDYPPEPPGTVCTDGNVMCEGIVGYKCMGGAWSLDFVQDTVCRNMPVPPITPTCTEKNVECREQVLYRCTGGKFVPTGEQCGVTPIAIVDSHGCVTSGGYIWCEDKRKCLKPEVEVCVIGTTPVVPLMPPDTTLQEPTIFGLNTQTLMILGIALIGGFMLFGGKK